MKSGNHKRDDRFGKVKSCDFESTKQTDLQPAVASLARDPKSQIANLCPVVWDELCRLHNSESPTFRLFTNSQNLGLVRRRSSHGGLGVDVVTLGRKLGSLMTPAPQLPLLTLLCRVMTSLSRSFSSYERGS